MAKKKHCVHVTVFFAESVALDGEIRFEKSFANCDPDAVVVSANQIAITYSRSSNRGKIKAINDTRV